MAQKKVETYEHMIDASGRTLGRVASEAAKALMGKVKADYTPHIRSEVRVKIINAKKLFVRDSKRRTKIYQDYSGYPGGQKVQTFRELEQRRGIAEPLRRAIARMLPRNTFRTPRLKNLEITE